MSLKTDRLAYDTAYAERSKQTWTEGPGTPSSEIRNWSSSVLLVATSPDYGEEISGLFNQIVHRGSFLPWTRKEDPTESMAGWYNGTKLSVQHLGITPGAFGASYMDMGLELFRGSKVNNVVIVGEMSSLQEHVKIGDLVVATSAIRADDSHLSYADPDVPAVADQRVVRVLREEARSTGRRTHSGVCWSCGAGPGIYDPYLNSISLEYCQMGILGNSLEAATAYLLGKSIGYRVGSLWLVADSIFEPISWKNPSPRLEWNQGWDSLIQAGLNTLSALEK